VARPGADGTRGRFPVEHDVAAMSTAAQQRACQDRPDPSNISYQLQDRLRKHGGPSAAQGQTALTFGP
jgi:hypothetical protein